MPFVAVLMGSDSDWPTMQATTEILDAFSISHEVRVSSAHRTPKKPLRTLKKLSGATAKCLSVLQV